MEREKKKEKAAKKKKEQTDKAAERADKKEKKLKAQKAKEEKQKEAASKEKVAKEKERQRKAAEEREAKRLKERKEKADRAEKRKKESDSKAREKATKEKEDKRKQRELKEKEVAEKARLENLAKVAAEKAAKEKEEKRQAELKAKAILAEKQEKERASKAKEKEEKRQEELKEKELRKRELAQKEAKRQAEIAQKKKEKADKALKEKAKKRAEAKERERKARCQKKKEAQENSIKNRFPKKIGISYRGGWTFWGSPYAPLALYAKGSVCQLEGRLRKSKTCVPSPNKCCDVAKLDEARCRPPKTLHFAVNHGHQQVAIQVKKNGFVCIGEFQPKWISLSGIIWTRANYMMEESTALLQEAEGAVAVEREAMDVQKNSRRRSSHTLQWSGQIQSLNGWEQKQALVTHKHGNLCILAGQLRGPGWLKPKGSSHRYVARLPENCRPAMRMMFSTQSMPQGRPLRVDVLADGRVEVIDVHGRPIEPLVVLDGIAFNTVEGSKIKLNTGFTAWGKGYHAPQAKAENGICHVQGLVKGNLIPRKVATLPEWCRPSKVLTFNSPNNRHVHRLDVLTNGEVWLKTQKRGGKDFVSLSAITFPIPYESAYGAIMRTPCK